MKKHVTALFLLVCLTLTFFISANAKDYTVNDILDMPIEQIKHISLYKASESSKNSYLSSGMSKQEKIQSFYNLIKTMPVMLTDNHDDRTKNTRFSFVFSTENKNWCSYNCRSGFAIFDGEKNIKLPYLLTEKDVQKIINNENIGWSGPGYPAVFIPPQTPLDIAWISYCSFRIGSNIYTINPQYEYGSKDFQEYEIDENPLVAPYLEEETQRTMLPLRCFATLFDFQVGWNEQTEEILLTKEPYQITMKLGSKLVKSELQNDSEILWTKEFEMETPAVTRFDRTFVPVRFLGELFGHNVDYGATGPNSGIAIGISRPRPTEQFLDIFPYIETEQEERTFGLDIMNSHKLPFLFPFSEEFQMNIRIYDLSGNLISETKKPVTETHNYLLLPPEQSIRTGCSVQTELEAGSYYADIKLNLPDFPDTYRMFLEVE